MNGAAAAYEFVSSAHHRHNIGVDCLDDIVRPVAAFMVPLLRLLQPEHSARLAAAALAALAVLAQQASAAVMAQRAIAGEGAEIMALLHAALPVLGLGMRRPGVLDAACTAKPDTPVQLLMALVLDAGPLPSHAVLSAFAPAACVVAAFLDTAL